MLELMRLNHDVSVLDLDYKTNMYGSPLLHVVDSTALYTTLNAAFIIWISRAKSRTGLLLCFCTNASTTMLCQKSSPLIENLPWSRRCNISLLRPKFCCVRHIKKKFTKNCKGFPGSNHKHFTKDRAAINSFYFATFIKLVSHLAEFHFFVWTCIQRRKRFVRDSCSVSRPASKCTRKHANTWTTRIYILKKGLLRHGQPTLRTLHILLPHVVESVRAGWKRTWARACRIWCNAARVSRCRS